MPELITLSREDDIAVLTLNRPDKLNAFTTEMRLEVIAAVEGMASDDGVRGVVLTGAGQAFSAGQDLSQSIAIKSINCMS